MVFGAHNAKSDAELIAITHSLWQNLGLKNITSEINTLGSNEARANYRLGAASINGCRSLFLESRILSGLVFRRLVESSSNW
jgi:histidyl-tRNA synthetase